MSHRRARHLNPKHAGATVVLDSRFMSGFANGDAVSSWTGRTSVNATSTLTLRPTYQSGSSDMIGGNPVVKFDGSNDKMEIDSSAYSIFNNVASGYAMFVGVDDNQSGGDATAHGFVSFAGSTGQAKIALYNDRPNSNKFSNNSRRVDSGGTSTAISSLPINVPFIGAGLANWSGNSVTCRQNGSSGSAVTLAAGAGFSTAADALSIRIGVYTTGAFPLPGRISLVIGISPAPSSPLIKRLEHSAAISFKIKCN